MVYEPYCEIRVFIAFGREMGRVAEKVADLNSIKLYCINITEFKTFKQLNETHKTKANKIDLLDV